ncbi:MULTISPECIES: MBL fold metallo-hydrolase [unclassified Marinobacterium]|uniref:MBL fold metallo-hydrolase n=1 Tax=unclassified Marinobacterium TaxID=2644139 RepID=UPI001569D5FF|nr:MULTISPECIES: 3',5'-cyclic-nucleotide phosphodiesterase [unclassified Marinobacterium]NRP10818.1 ribonuclease Z [Marinobacterium sp. xm-g-48]NRP14902.1 ribonuclease Z [Marinobacterium sp. xm-a-152]NRP38629.1 ribonuclease Z [Marinobacterium sp. xm-a-121]NRP83788.1 ribonuclease Z [Marinobacterium sp. xm-d-509]NRP95008.1 ribonuclease Z [Marinobacterium sp. xm-g-59]
MKVRNLGCSGGLAEGLFTTSFLLDERTLLDGGTGVGRLSLAQMNQIETVLLTHAHMDHIAGVAMMLASLSEHRKKPVILAAPKEVLEAVKAHILNWVIWPDFSKIPNEQTPVLEYLELEPFQTLELNGYQVMPIPLSHTVPSYAYRISRGEGAFCFFGDTGPTELVWQALNQQPVSDIFIELSYRNDSAELAGISKHYTSVTLAEDLAKLDEPSKVHIMHLKPGVEDQIIAEFSECSKSLHHCFDLCHEIEAFNI